MFLSFWAKISMALSLESQCCAVDNNSCASRDIRHPGRAAASAVKIYFEQPQYWPSGRKCGPFEDRKRDQTAVQFNPRFGPGPWGYMRQCWHIYAPWPQHSRKFKPCCSAQEQRSRPFLTKPSPRLEMESMTRTYKRRSSTSPPYACGNGTPDLDTPSASAPESILEPLISESQANKG